MKHTILLVSLFVTLSVGAAGVSENEFKSEVIRIFNEQDWDGYRAITFDEGMTAYDREMMENLKPVILQGQKVASVTFEPLPPDFRKRFVYQGREFEPTISPVGVLEIKDEDGGTSVLPYARTSDGYVLVTTKSVDLDWDGPEDISLQIILVGRNNENLQVEASWNASGKDFSGKIHYGTTSFWGQYVENVKVVSDDPEADFQLRVLEGENEVFKSKRIRGVGKIEYDRDENPTAR